MLLMVFVVLVHFQVASADEAVSAIATLLRTTADLIPNT
jgi:hypothetical protein